MKYFKSTNLKRRVSGYLFLFVFYPLLNLNSQYIDPELERYFEKHYGYLKSELRDSPISTVSTDVIKEFNKKNSIIVYSKLPEPNYTNTPLHYDLKKQNTTGAISYYIAKANNNTTNIKAYTLIDVTLPDNQYSSVISQLNNIGFVIAGEERYLDAKNYVTLFGWIEDKNFNMALRIKGIDKVSLSKREIKAPLTNITFTVKVPNNRDIVVFSDKLIEKLSEYGFVKNELKIISDDKKYRFIFLEIKGMIPLDKIQTILKSPFIIEAKS